ncbi:S8 family serine peptidase [Streptomyces sp. H27-H5]|uniref:S8 family serine peptidase n=1 Tax=Streptomyces sp. H27-H5 TaxID=2996460 RepID=UPI00226F7FB3|nr:S8 family serine peptidase [Streptomyces sp. H27-H5]MCY0962564.1 S8 family serine peptidase [Streptomyces sp. H27-H5]
MLAGERRRFSRAAGPVLAGLLVVGVAAAPAGAATPRERQWHLTAMKAADFWKIGTGKGVTVAVIDSGVGRAPELEGQVLPGVDLAGGKVGKAAGDERTDPDGHGTSMATIIAGTGRAAGGEGLSGIAPGARILPIRVPREDAPGASSWAAAIRRAADSDAKVVNISMSTTTADPARDDAVKYALSKGKLVFAAMGEGGTTGTTPAAVAAKKAGEPRYPAATPGVVGVAAVGPNGEPTAESLTGPQVDMAAPGVDILTYCRGRAGYCESHGTGEATALASASAALLWSAHPDWTNNQVLRVLLHTSGAPVDGAVRNDWIGYGVARPRIAMSTPGPPGPADVYPLPDFVSAAAAMTVGAGEPSTDSGADEVAGLRGAVGWIGLGLVGVLIIGGAVSTVLARRTAD